MATLHDMSVLDWVILAQVSISVVGSFLKGFARETISLASVVVGLLGAAWFYPATTVFFLGFVETEDIAAVLGFVSIFAGCLVMGAIVSFFMHKFVRLAHLRWFDRLLGTAFGLIRGWMIATVLVLVLTAFPVGLASVQESRLAPYLLISARVLVVITPQSLKNRFMEGYAEVERLWREQTDPPNEADAHPVPAPDPPAAAGDRGQPVR